MQLTICVGVGEANINPTQMQFSSARTQICSSILLIQQPLLLSFAKHIHNVYKTPCKSPMPSHLSVSHSPWPLGIKTSRRSMLCVAAAELAREREREMISESCNHRCCLLLIDSLLNFIMPKGGASRRELPTSVHTCIYNRWESFFLSECCGDALVLCKTAATPNLRRWVFFRWITPVPLRGQRPAPIHVHTVTTHSVNAIWQWCKSWK